MTPDPNRSRPCPPPLVRPFPQAPCVRPGFVATFGGPASGLWPSGGQIAAPPAPSVIPGPSPTPVPTCVTTTLFSECFTGCTAPTNCGWTIVTPAGTVVFDGTKLIEGSSGANAQGEARKALPGVPTGSFTAQFAFQEIAAATSANKTYALGMFDSLGNGVFSIGLIADGTVIIGDQTDIYIGTWTPVAGASHIVHITRAGAGSLTLMIDGAMIALTPIAPGPVVGVPSVVDASIANNDLDGQGSYDNIFLTDGILPASTVFCCP